MRGYFFSESIGDINHFVETYHLFKQLEHPNLVKCMGWCKPLIEFNWNLNSSPGSAYFVLSPFNPTKLLINTLDTISATVRSQVVVQIAQLLEYLHSHDVALFKMSSEVISVKFPVVLHI